MPLLQCHFALAPMADRFVEIILEAVGRVDTGAIHAKTGRMNTCYEGAPEKVMAALYTCFTAARREGVHMTMHAVFTSPKGEGAPAPFIPAENASPCLCETAVYRPEGAGIILPQKTALRAKPTQWGALLEGRTDGVFAALYETVCAAQSQGECVVTADFSVNSPTPPERG